jgi:hypothetical protein
MEDANVNEFRKRVLEGEFSHAISDPISKLNLTQE